MNDEIIILKSTEEVEKFIDEQNRLHEKNPNEYEKLYLLNSEINEFLRDDDYDEKTEQ